MKSMRYMIGAALLVMVLACGPVGIGATGSPTALATLTPTPTFEIFSPTALPVLTTPTQVAATEPATSSSPTAIPVPQAGACSPAAIDPAFMGPFKWVAYCDTIYWFGFRYPQVGDAYQGNGRIILPMVLGTNLREKWLQVTVSEGAATCTSPESAGYEPGSIPTENVTFNGTRFIKESGGQGAAGNFYDWVGYSTMNGSQCVSMTFMLHSLNRLNFPTPPPEFDKTSESAVFTAIMSTFTWFLP